VTTLLCASPHCALPGLHLVDPDPEHDEETCRGCLPARAADGLYLCQRCAGLVKQDAWGAASLYVDLEEAMASAAPRPSDGSSHVGMPSGVDLHPIAVEARGIIRSTLVSLCRMVAEELGIALPADTVPEMAKYLARHARWLAAHPAAGEIAGELRDVVTDSRTRRVAYAVPNDRILIGLCNQVCEAASGELVVCGARLWSRPPDVGTLHEEVIVCPNCGTGGTVRWWRWELCASIDGMEVFDAYEAAAYLSWRWAREVQPGLIWQWGRRYPDAGMLRQLVDVTPLGAMERVFIEGQPLKDRQGRVLFVRAMLEQRSVKMWGAAEDLLSRAV